MAIEASKAPASQPFTNWKNAVAALRRAEDAGGTLYAELVHLSEQVILTRNLLTADWVTAGLALPEAVARQYAADSQLLRLPDDTWHHEVA
jgi:hypothetical protein